MIDDRKDRPESIESEGSVDETSFWTRRIHISRTKFYSAMAGLLALGTGVNLYVWDKAAKLEQKRVAEIAQAAGEQSESIDTKTHEFMLEILRRLHRNNESEPTYYSFHPKGSDNEHPSNPIYGFPYQARQALPKINENYMRMEYDIYLAVGLAHKKAGINTVRMGGISGNSKITAKNKVLQLPEQPLSYEEYVKFVRTNKSGFWKDSDITLSEILAVQFPQLNVVGADMVWEPEQEK